jgi:YHS domain-containing protein
MKQPLACAVAILLSIGLAGCNDTNKDAPRKDDAARPATRPTTKPVAFNKFCPIEPEHAIDKDVLYTYNGKAYGFCCEGCIDEFKKNPEKYKNAK